MTDYRNNDDHRDHDDDDFDDLPDGLNAPIPESNNGSDDVPDGKYQARIVSAALVRIKKDYSISLKMELEVMGGKYAKSRLEKWSRFATPENQGYVKKDMATLKITLAGGSLKDIKNHLGEMANKAVEVQVKNREGLPCNVYINKLITGTAPANVTNAAPQPVAQPPKKGYW